MICQVSRKHTFDLVFRQQTVSIRLTEDTTDFSFKRMLSKMGDKRFLTILRRAMTVKSLGWEQAGPVELIGGYSRTM